jgi:hypothetical protein
MGQSGISVVINDVVKVKGVGVGLHVEDLAVVVELEGHHRFMIEWLAYLRVSYLTFCWRQ